MARRCGLGRAEAFGLGGRVQHLSMAHSKLLQQPLTGGCGETGCGVCSLSSPPFSVPTSDPLCLYIRQIRPAQTSHSCLRDVKEACKVLIDSFLFLCESSVCVCTYMFVYMQVHMNVCACTCVDQDLSVTLHCFPSCFGDGGLSLDLEFAIRARLAGQSPQDSVVSNPC